MSCVLTTTTVGIAFTIVASVYSPLTLEGGEYEPPQPIFEEFRALPVEEQSERLTWLAEQGTLIAGLDTPSEFAILASDQAFHQYMEFLLEPLVVEWLDALDALLQKSNYDSARFRAAVLLFRHGRERGRAYLLRRLQEDHDLRAALVFAVAQEEGTESAIANAVVIALTERRDRYALDDAIIRWNSDALIAALSRPEVRDAFKARSALASYARLVGVAADAESSMQLREAAFETPHYRISTRLTMAAASVRRDPNDDAAWELLVQELNERPKWWVFQAISETADPRFINVLLDALSDLLSPQENETRDERHERWRNAESALESIVRLGGDLPVIDTISLHTMRPTQRLELMMIRSGNELLVDRVRERLGDKEVDRIKTLQQLKPVPDSLPHYVPRSSRGWVWY